MNRKIKKQEKQSEKYHKFYDDLVTKLKAEGKYEDARETEEERRGLWYQEHGFVIDLEKTDYYRSKLKSHRLNMPIDQKYWDDYYGQRILSDLGFEKCDSLIRLRKKENREAFVQISSAIIGVLGVVVAIIALIIAA